MSTDVSFGLHDNLVRLAQLFLLQMEKLRLGEVTGPTQLEAGGIKPPGS